MKHFPLVLPTGVAVLAASFGESRTWISNDGRPIDGEYLRAFDNESGEENDVHHVKRVAAMRKDMGID